MTGDKESTAEGALEAMKIIVDHFNPYESQSFAPPAGSENRPTCPECGQRFALTEHDHLDSVEWSNVLCCGKSFRVVKRTDVRWLISPNAPGERPGATTKKETNAN